MPKEFHTVKETAERYGIGQWWLYEQVAAKAIPHYRVGRNLRFSWTELDEFFRRVAEES